ncbi:hypothetical protein Trydic_g7231 [Trypoxylus dichotomus]
MSEHITSNMDKSTPTATIMLDIEKAIDKIWYDGLVHKMRLHRTEHFMLKTLPLPEQRKQEFRKTRLKREKKNNLNLTTGGNSRTDMEEIFADKLDEPFLRELIVKIMEIYQRIFGERSELDESKTEEYMEQQKGVRRGA